MKTELKRRPSKQLRVKDLKRGDLFFFPNMCDEDNIYLMCEDCYVSLSGGFYFDAHKFAHYNVVKVVQTEPLKVEEV